MAHSGSRLIEQDDLGAARDGDPDLERALLTWVSTPAGTRGGSKIDLVGICSVCSRNVASESMPCQNEYLYCSDQHAATMFSTRSGAEDIGDHKLREAMVYLLRPGAGNVTPCRRIEPALGLSRPLVRLNSVDLPAPFGP
jgi:hypothetical protein